MKKILTTLIVGTSICAAAMVAVSAGDKKISNSVETKEAVANDLLHKAGEKTNASLAIEGLNPGIDSKIENVFLLADLDADGLLSETEYVDFQVSKAKSSFKVMAGDDAFASVDEVKNWYLAKQEEKPAKPITDIVKGDSGSR